MKNFLKKLCAIFVFYLCFAAPLFAQSYACKIKQNGYAHALNAISGAQNKKLEYAKAWMPEQFTVNADYLKFKNFQPLEIVGGNRESNFQANLKTSKYRVSYTLNINKHTGSGTVYLMPQNYKRVGPAFYNCTQTDKSDLEKETIQNSIESKPNSKGITDDIRYILKVFSDETCINKLSNWYRQNHEIFAIILGLGVIDSIDFTNANSKQSAFKKLALMNDSKILPKHKNKIISFLGYSSSYNCQGDLNKISDPILRGFIRSGDERRASLIEKIKANNATYYDVTLMFVYENSQHEDIFKHWEINDPEGMEELSGEMVRFLKAYQRMTDPFSEILRTHYDIY